MPEVFLPTRSARTPRRTNQLNVFQIEGMAVTYKDIAARLGVTESAASSRRRQALKHLRKGEPLTWAHLER